MHVTDAFTRHMPPDWNSVPLLVWGYQVVFAKKPVPMTPLVWSTAGVHCLLVSGSYTYYRTGKLRFGSAPDGSGEPNLGVASTPDGLWLLVGAPTTVAATTLRSAVALLAIWLGRNAVYEKYFEFRMDPPKAQVSVCTSAMLNPWYSPQVDFGQLSHVETASQFLVSLSDADRSRLLLSLRWYSDTLDSSGTDQFLRLWIAFEVLAMNSTNVKSAADLLANTYGLAKGKATATLRIGRLHGLRSTILHKGTVTSPLPLVIDFLDAIYTDCMSFRLTGRSTRKALLLLDTPSSQIDEAISQSTR